MRMPASVPGARRGRKPRSSSAAARPGERAARRRGRAGFSGLAPGRTGRPPAPCQGGGRPPGSSGSLRLFSSCRISSSMLVIFSALAFAMYQSLLSIFVWNGFLRTIGFPFYSCLSASIIFRSLSRNVSVPLWLKNSSARQVGGQDFLYIQFHSSMPPFFRFLAVSRVRFFAISLKWESWPNSDGFFCAERFRFFPAYSAKPGTWRCPTRRAGLSTSGDIPVATRNPLG